MVPVLTFKKAQTTAESVETPALPTKAVQMVPATNVSLTVFQVNE